jgi:hypothetical protein
MARNHLPHARPVRTALVLASLVAIAGIAGHAAAATTAAPTYAMTIYQPADAEPLFEGPVDFEPPPGYALVNERRGAETGEGRGTLTLKAFPRWLQADSLTVSLAHGQVLSQRFEAEPLRSERLLERSVGRQVTIDLVEGSDGGALSGELLTSALPIALRLDDGRIVTVNDYSRITVTSPPVVNALPQLRLGVDSARAGLQDVSLTYPVAGIAWRAEYVARIADANDCRVDFTAHARIVNRSGHGFTGAGVRLVPGEPPLNADPDAFPAGTGGEVLVPMQAALDLPDGSSQKVALAPEKRALECSRGWTYVGQPLRANPGRVPITDATYGRGGSAQVRSSVSFRPGHEIALPAGRLRVLRAAGDDDALQPLGERDFDAVPPGGRVDIALGIDEALTAERLVGELQRDPSGPGLAETVSILLRSHGKAAKVRVREHLYRWTQWEISRNTQPFEQVDDDAIEFLVDVPPGGEASLSYRVRYRWNEDFR